MKRYYKFLDSNQGYADCQLITAINASIFFHKKMIVKPKSKEYEYLVDLVGCRHGSAISVEKAYPYLGIKVKKKYKGHKGIHDLLFYSADWSDLPLGLTIWRSRVGYHSICAIDYCKKSESIQIMNFEHETTGRCWMFLENLKYFVDSAGKSARIESFKKAPIKKLIIKEEKS